MRLKFHILCCALFLSVVGVMLCGALPGSAQETQQAPRVLVVDGANVETLLRLPAPRTVRDATTGVRRRAEGDVDAVEINVNRAALQNAPAATEKLRVWVRSGGVALFHTDAAQLFGFTTQPVRLATRDKGGQLFGYAQSALPPGALSLMDGATVRSPWGVREVWYQLAPGDHLAMRHPQGLPLLRVNDLADLQPPAVALYATVLVPEGQGFLLFSPRQIEEHRGDGALYAQNLRQFLFASATPPDNALRLCAVPSSLSAQLAALAPEEKPAPTAGAKGIAIPDEEVRALLASRAITLLPNLDQVLSGAALNDESSTKSSVSSDSTTGNSTTGSSSGNMNAPLLAPRAEVLAVRAALRLLAPSKAHAPPDMSLVLRLREALVAQGLLWQAQRAWQSNALEAAEQCVSNAEKHAPQSLETTYWRGVIALQAGIEAHRPAPEAAQWLDRARDFWKRAATRPSVWNILPAT